MIINKTIYYKLDEDYFLIITEHFQINLIERVKKRKEIFEILNKLKNIKINEIKIYLNKEILLKYMNYNIYIHVVYNKSRKRFEVEVITITPDNFNGHYDIKANLTELSTIY